MATEGRNPTDSKTRIATESENPRILAGKFTATRLELIHHHDVMRQFISKVDTDVEYRLEPLVRMRNQCKLSWCTVYELETKV